MKIKFKDGSYIECVKSHNSDKILFCISAKDYDNTLKRVNNTIELTIDEFKQLISEV